jgi:hypothetical protein
MFKTVGHHDNAGFAERATSYALGGILAFFVFGLVLIAA